MTKQFLAIAVAALTILSGCKKDDDAVQTDSSVKGEIILSAELSARTRTASLNLQETTFAEGTTFGVFLTDASETPIASYAIQNANRELTLAADGTLSVEEGGKNLTFPTAKSDSKANIYAYAPYDATYALDGDNIFEVAQDQTEDEGYISSDLLFGTPATNPIESANYTEAAEVELQFKHTLSKVKFVFTAANDEVDLRSGQAKIVNSVTKGKIDLTTGSVSVGSRTTNDIIIGEVAKGETRVASYECTGIVIPQSFDAGTNIAEFIIGDEKVCCEVSEATVWESNKMYVYEVSVPITYSSDVENTTRVSISLKAVLEGWDEQAATVLSTEAMKNCEIGDFVLSDGTIIPSDSIVSVYNSLYYGIAGMVVGEIPQETTDYADGYRYYVMALRSTANSTLFRATDVTMTHTDKIYTSDSKDFLSDFEGRANTKAMREFAAENSLKEGKALSQLDEISKSNPDISGFKNSGWFIPSTGQWWLVLQNIGGLTEDDFQEKLTSTINNSSSFYTNFGKAVTAKLDSIDGLVGGIRGGNTTDYDYENFYAKCSNPIIMFTSSTLNSSTQCWTVSLYSTSKTLSFSTLMSSCGPWYFFAM